MMTAHANDWSEVADALGGLAMKLKLHFEQAADEPGQEIEAALDKMGDAIETAFDALRAAVKDPAVQQDVKDVGAELRDALRNTLTGMSARMRHAVECDPRD